MQALTTRCHDPHGKKRRGGESLRKVSTNGITLNQIGLTALISSKWKWRLGFHQAMAWYFYPCWISHPFTLQEASATCGPRNGFLLPRKSRRSRVDWSWRDFHDQSWSSTCEREGGDAVLSNHMEIRAKFVNFVDAPVIGQWHPFAWRRDPVPSSWVSIVRVFS